MKAAKGIKLDTEFDADDLKNMIVRFKEFYHQNKGTDFPTDPKIQLIEAVKAVFRSWDNERAIFYRK